MKRTKLPKPRKGAWFIPLRGSYLPASWQGWLLYVPYTLYIVLAGLVVIKTSQSIVAAMVTLVPYLVSGLIIMTWIAKQKS